jgi:peptidoglycan/xylan/chitin deacetylase (PgdA/CDA1 family)/glycosyltransferase involved in cell wall biosynthesis
MEAKMSSVKLSVVMTTFNRRSALERTLPTLLRQDFPSTDGEIVVVVDGSTDGTLEFLRCLKSPFRLKVLSQPNRGFAAARNAGLQAAEGDLVLFLDDDIICTPGVFKQHCAAHAAGTGPLLAHGPVRVAPGGDRTLIRYASEVWDELYYGRLDPAVGIRLPQDVYFISNSSIRRETLLAFGGFDERVLGMDDMDFGLRLWERGVRFQYLPGAEAFELWVKPTGAFLQKQVKRWARGDIYISRKHPEFRPYSRIAGVGQPRGWKHVVRDMLVRSPVSPLPLFTAPLWIAERLYRFVPVRKAGLRLLNLASRVALLRYALQEAGSWRALRHEFGMKLPILLFHHVGPPPAGDSGLTVSPERFEAQVHWLARRGYVGICPSDWLAWCRTGKPLPEKPVLLTFDDAYADLAQYAFPVLERHGFGAAVFVITGRVGGTVEWPRVKGVFQLMNAEQIRHWAKRGIEFGAHSRTHPDLTTLSPSDLVEEVAGSKRDLEAILQAPVISFAYPYGPYNPAVCECVRGLYDLAFTTDEGLNDLRSELHLLRRSGVCLSDTRVDLASRLRWGFSPLERLRYRIRLRTRLRNVARAVLARS